MAEPATSLDEIRALFGHLPGPDFDAGSAAATREAQLTKPAGALGRLEELAAWLATWQGRHPPRIDHPRVVVFAGNHGVAVRGVSAYPAAVTAQMVQNFIAGGAAVNQLCRVVDADLRVYEMNLEEPTADIVEAPAMTEEECARAIAYGMMAVEAGIDALAVGEMGIANTTVAAALCLALFGGDAADWTGPGTGVAGAALANKRDVVAAAVARHKPESGDPFDVLRRLGGLEFAAMAGAILAARMGRVPVVLDGFCAGAAAAVLGRARPPPPARQDRQVPAARSRHAIGRSLGRDARSRAAESRRRLPWRHGDVCRRRGQRAQRLTLLGLSDAPPPGS
jgi:nicotinate-nucleotide--dimethylbenzimidazole phosphoribosyltransferase